MSRNILTTITAYDYADFKQEHSEKNIINQTNGTEYIIDAASVTNIVDINNRSMEIPITPLNGGNSARCWDWAIGDARGLFVGQQIQARNEYFWASGSLTIETDNIITDVNSIAVKTTLYYDKYHGDVDIVTDSNYKGSNSVYKQLMTNQYKQNDDLLAVNEELPYETSELKIARLDFFGGRVWYKSYKCSSNFPKNSIKITCKKLPNDHYQIKINYTICTWWGKNYAEAGKWSQYNSATLWAVKKISFSVTANTVDAREVEFGYSRSENENYGNAQGKNYALESNEFIQTDENTSQSSRTSFQISQEIFDKFDQDRSIATFKLVNCEKYFVDNAYRYLRTEDLIYIEDENGELISDEIDANGDLVPSVFEIIKTRPIWDGTFSMEVVCKKVDMTT